MEMNWNISIHFADNVIQITFRLWNNFTREVIVCLKFLLLKWIECRTGKDWSLIRTKLLKKGILGRIYTQKIVTTEYAVANHQTLLKTKWVACCSVYKVMKSGQLLTVNFQYKLHFSTERKKYSDIKCYIVYDTYLK